MLRPGVELVGGSEVRVARPLADVGPADVVVVIDLARYDRGVLDAAGRAAEPGRRPGRPDRQRPLARWPRRAPGSASRRRSPAPAPSTAMSGLLALANALLAGVAARLRRSATDRLDQVEAAWRAAAALTDG